MQFALPSYGLMYLSRVDADAHQKWSPSVRNPEARLKYPSTLYLVSSPPGGAFRRFGQPFLGRRPGPLSATAGLKLLLFIPTRLCLFLAAEHQSLDPLMSVL